MRLKTYLFFRSAKDNMGLIEGHYIHIVKVVCESCQYISDSHSQLIKV